jgi:serine protease Do
MGEPEGDRPEGSPDDADTHLRGWIDPDDRLWRHPSELAGGPGFTALSAPPGARHGRLMMVIGAAAALAAVAWVGVLLSPASDRPAPSDGTSASNAANDSPLTTLTARNGNVPAAAEGASQSMVELQAATAHGNVTLIGVAVAEGGLVATTASSLTGLRSLSMVGPDGHLLRASVVAIDKDSDLALVNVPDDVPVATFADDGSLASGSGDLLLSMAATGGSTPAVRCTPGTVSAVGTPIAGGPAAGMPAITSSAPNLTEQSGDLLLNAAGSVLGILYGTGATPTFLPTQLVLGVADDLRSSGRVAHGWLGVEGTDGPSTTGGAQVSAVMAGSPAARYLQAGEVIVQVGSVPVRTMAELRGRLYVLAPDTTVVLSVLSGAATRVVDVTLSASP